MDQYARQTLNYVSHDVDDYSTETLERGTILVHNNDCEKFLEGTSIYRVFGEGGKLSFRLRSKTGHRPYVLSSLFVRHSLARMLRRRHRNKTNATSEETQMNFS